MIAWIVSLSYLAGFLAAIDAVMYARTPQGAVAWAVSLVTFPFLAVPAYLVLGRSKFEGMSELFEDRRGEIERILADYDAELAPWVDRTRWQTFLVQGCQAAVPELDLTRGNSVELLVNGDATFSSILEGVAHAEQYVLFQFYMIHDDGLGRRVKAALVDRAQAGVRVYVLYDEVGSKGLPKAYTDELRAAGIEVSSFKPTQGCRNRFQINFRNHRKMVVVDGKTAWVGGHNVGDEYLGLDPGFSPWRDTHVRLEGPVTLQLQRVILSDWYWATHEIPEVTWTPTPAAEADSKVMILPTGPTRHLETASLFFVSALSSAEDRIWLSAPYFVPDEAVMKALQLAALRGVDVRIITTGKGDSKSVFLAAFHFIHELRGLGIRFYAYKPGFLHEKVTLVDDYLATVGTHNFDNRSFRLNFEVTSIIEDEEFASKMELMFERDFEHAEIIDAEAWDEKSFWWRLAVKASRLAAPVL